MPVRRRIINIGHKKPKKVRCYPNYNDNTWERPVLDIIKPVGPELRWKYFLPSYSTYHLLITLTYASDLPSPNVWKHYRQFLSRLQTVQPCQSFAVLELQERGTPHIHAIIQFYDPIPGVSRFARKGHKLKYRLNSPLQHYIKTLWKHGFLDIQAIKGAANSAYTLKYLTKTTANMVRGLQPNHGHDDDYIKQAKDYQHLIERKRKEKIKIPISFELNEIFKQIHQNQIHDLKLHLFELTEEFSFEKLYYAE